MWLNNKFLKARSIAVKFQNPKYENKQLTSSKEKQIADKEISANWC